MHATKLLQNNKLHPECIDLGDGRVLELGDVIGKGGAAAVYRARLCTQNRVRRPVAVKLFNAVATDEAEQVVELLTSTARRLACIDHPNIARVYEVGEWRGQPFVITELVDGVSLAKLHETFTSKKRRMPLDLALFVACEVAEALSAARLQRDYDGMQLNIVHHSLAAREVLLSWRGEVKVTDFETSTARPASSAVRSMRGVAGRAIGMAPEVAQGCDADARADVFSFGIMLRELLIGPRFPAELSNADAIRLAREGYVQPITFQPHLPDSIVSIMVRALQVEPEARYPNASAMALDLRRAAFAMGVGDGRYFLRSALEREWSQYADEITAEHALSTVSAEPVDDLSDLEGLTPHIERLRHEEHIELKDNDVLSSLRSSNRGDVQLAYGELESVELFDVRTSVQKAKRRK